MAIVVLGEALGPVAQLIVTDPAQGMGNLVRAADLHAEVERVQTDLLCSLLQHWIEAAKRNEALTWLRTVELLQESITEAYEKDLQVCPLATFLKDLFGLLVERGQSEQPESRIVNQLNQRIEQESREVVSKITEAFESGRHKAFEADLTFGRLQSEAPAPPVSRPPLEYLFYQRGKKYLN